MGPFCTGEPIPPPPPPRPSAVCFPGDLCALSLGRGKTKFRWSGTACLVLWALGPNSGAPCHLSTRAEH